jgi:hypothetical protein
LSEKDYATYSIEQVYDWVLKSSARIIAVIGTKEYMKDLNFGKSLTTYNILNDVLLKIYEFDESLKIYE